MKRLNGIGLRTQPWRGRVVRDRVVAVGGVAADEVDGEVHALGVVAGLLHVEAELAAHGRGRGGAGGDVEGVDRGVALDQRHHLARDVDLDVAALVVTGLEAALAHQQLAEDRAAVGLAAAHAVGLAEGLDREPGALGDAGALGAGVEALGLQRAVEQPRDRSLAEVLGDVDVEGGGGALAGVLGLDPIAAAGVDLERHLEGAVGLGAELLREQLAAAGADGELHVVGGDRSGELAPHGHLLQQVHAARLAPHLDADARRGGAGVGLLRRLRHAGGQRQNQRGSACEQRHTCPATGDHRGGIVADEQAPTGR